MGDVAIPNLVGDRKHRVFVERSTLIWNYTTVEDAGYYSCVGCSGVLGSQTCSEPFEFDVRINERPSFVTKPRTGYSPQVGTNLVIDCSAVGSPAPQYTWLINGQNYLSKFIF